MSVFSVWFILHHVLQYNHGMLQLHDCASDDLFAFSIISLTRASNSFLIPTIRRFAANRSSSDLNLTGAKVYILFSPFSLFIFQQKARLIILLASTKWSDSFSPALIQDSFAFSMLEPLEQFYNIFAFHLYCLLFAWFVICSSFKFRCKGTTYLWHLQVFVRFFFVIDFVTKVKILLSTCWYYFFFFYFVLIRVRCNY